MTLPLGTFRKSRSDPRSPPLDRGRRLAAGLAALSVAATGFAQPPQLEAGDAAARHHLTTLVDAGALRLPISAWPLPSQGLARELDRLDTSALSASEHESLRSLQALLGLSGRNVAQLFLGSEREPLRGFASDQRESNGLRLSLHGSVAAVHGRLALTQVADPVDGQDTRLDHSYVAFDWGQWQLGVGRVERWWGPGWQSSLILSSNARPSPGVFLARNHSQASELPVARWLGPWRLSAFANELESNRHVSRAKLLGARFGFSPADWLELGISRTAQWGGEGRPESASSLWDLILGRDNRGDDGIDEDGSNEPGNQLGGLDWRIRLPSESVPLAFYGQIIGEDEAGGLPSRHIGMAGLEAPFSIGKSRGRLFFEASDTSMRFQRDPLYNSAYNHSLYRSGYRYKGRPIGASTDNDTRTFAIGGYHELPQQQAILWKTLYGDLNRDGAPGRNAVSESAVETWLVSLEYRRELSEQLELSLLAFHMSKRLEPADPIGRNGLQLRLNWRLKP